MRKDHIWFPADGLFVVLGLGLYAWEIISLMQISSRLLLQIRLVEFICGVPLILADKLKEWIIRVWGCPRDEF